MAAQIQLDMDEIIKPEIRAQFITKTLKDEAFRLALLKNPKKAIKDEFGVDVPSGTTIHVVEQSPSTSHVVIPRKPGGIASDMTLEKILDLITRDMPKLKGQLNETITSFGRVVAKSWTDSAYRKRLVADPKAVISKEAGITFPADQKFVVHLEDDKNRYFALPPSTLGRELTDEEMEIISGGSTIASFFFYLVEFVFALAGGIAGSIW